MALSRKYWVIINIIIATVMIATLTNRHDHLLNTREQRVIKTEQDLLDTKHGMSRKPNEKMLENDKISSICNLENVEVLNNHKNYWNFKQKFCGMDQKRLNILESLNLSSHPSEQIEHALHRFSMDRTDTVCKEKVTFGGGCWPHCHYIDGAKNIYMDELIQDRAKNECLIFSFVF